MAVIDLEVPDEQVVRLDRIATAMRKTRREATAQLIEEALRHEEYPCVDFRDSTIGRQAYVVGSGLAVWEMVMVAESYQLDPVPVAAHFGWPVAKVEGVLAYYRAYPVDIDRVIRENDAITEEEMRRNLPNAVWQ